MIPVTGSYVAVSGVKAFITLAESEKNNAFESIESSVADTNVWLLACPPALPTLTVIVFDVTPVTLTGSLYAG